MNAAPRHLLKSDPERNPIASTYWAARVLLTGLDCGQNVDSLARRTGCSRNFIAKCSRRLIDNGIWRGGRTICDWQHERQLSASFWKDVAVAEGKLCRRVGEDGQFEWAAVGEWTKRYDYVKVEPDGLGVEYIVPEPYDPEVEAPLASADHESDTDREPEPQPQPKKPKEAVHARPIAPAPKEPVENPSRPAQPPVSDARPAPRPSQPLPEIFPDAEWLM